MAIRPGSYVTIDFGRSASGPTPRSGVERFHTVAFDHGVMRQMLSFEENGRVLEAGLWIDCAVPECYRSRVREIVLQVFDEKFRGRLYKPGVLDEVVHELRHAIWRDLEPVPPSCCEGDPR